MIRKIIILSVALLMSVQIFGQGSTERVAFKNIQRKKWAKAHSQLTKAMLKDSVNVAAAYVLAEYFFAPGNPDFQLDSAYHYTLIAINNLQNASTKHQERLHRNFIDSLSLMNFRQQVDSSGFMRARQLDTEKAYIDFLSVFTFAGQRNEAMMLRNEAAYRDAVDENSYEAFQNFMIRYPEAERIADARKHYDELLFKAKTTDKRLSSYERYLKEYPRSPYYKEVMQAIFEIRTAPGTKESFRSFLDSYGETPLARVAANILFYLTPDEQRESQITYMASDSLKTALALAQGYLVPFLRDDAFGFINQDGVETIKAEAREISAAYRCGNVTDDVIILPDKLVTPAGELISRCSVQSMEEIGYGYLLLTEQLCQRVIHKTGFQVGGNCIEDAKVLNERFLALKKDNRWSVWTLTGRLLIPYGWDDISTIANVMVLHKDGQYALTSADAVANVANNVELILSPFVDDVKAWANSFIWVKKGDREGILDIALDTLVSAEQQHLSPAYFGATSMSSSGARTFNKHGEGSLPFKQIAMRTPWTAVKKDSTWRLFNPGTGKFQSPPTDSITFEGPFAICQNKDSTTIHFSATNGLTFPNPLSTAFIPGQDSSTFLMVSQKDKKNIYGSNGKKLFTTTNDHVQYAGEGFFTVLKKDKKGLINAAGKPLLPLEYDAIGMVNKGMVSLLKSSKFGLFDCQRKKLIKPQYAKNLTRYNDKVIVAYKDGLYGFVDWNNKPLGKMEFNAIAYWNDSAAFVQKNFEWMLYEINTKRVLLDKIREYEIIRGDHDDKLAIIQQEHNYGVIHSAKGIIIPISFSDIINVGSADQPLYFTEKHVEEASIFIVIYYDASGTMLRKEVYEHDDYEKIYCSNK